MHGQFSATGSLIPLPWKVCCTLYLNIYKEEGAVYLFYIFNSGILETTVSGINIAMEVYKAKFCVVSWVKKYIIFNLFSS